MFALFLIVAIMLCNNGLSLRAASREHLKTIVIGVPTDRPPMIYIDAKSGSVTGIGAELLKAAAEDAGYNIIFKSIGNSTLKEALDNDEFDLVMPLGSNITSATGQNSIVSEALLQTPMTLLTVGNKEIPEIKNIKVGMIKTQAGVVESINKLHLGMEIILYDNIDESIEALIKGEVDALLNNSYIWSYILQKPEYSHFTIQPTTMILMDFRVGALDSPESREIINNLNKSIIKVPDAKKQAVVLDHTTRKLYKYTIYDYLHQYSIFFAGLLVITLIVYIYVRQLRRAKRIAEEASKAKSDFLARMSHEIRTPINAIMGMGELIYRETSDNKLKQYAYSINSSANSLLCLVNDVLDFSKMEAGKLKIRNDPYRLSNIIRDVEIMIRQRAESKGLSYLADIDESTPGELYGDEIRIKQVLINLLTNAVKYTKTGTVTLKVGYEKVDEENINLKISVIDTGIGMKKEEIGKLFVAFERLDEDKNKTIEGTGLGMSIVKKLLDAMEGNLEVESVYGEGSTFSISLIQKVSDWKGMGKPDSAYDENNSSDKDYKPIFYAPDARILSVDDTEINLKVIAGLLEQTKVMVDSVLSAKDALEKMKSVKYDILLIDHRMPEMDGMELIKKIRKDRSNINQKSVCIALTANVVEGARDMYMKAGFNDYMEKPVKAKKLEEMLTKYLPEDKVLMSDKYILYSPSKK